MKKIILLFSLLAKFSFSQETIDSALGEVNSPNRYQINWALVPGISYSPNSEDGFFYVQVQRSLLKKMGLWATFDYHMRLGTKNLLRQSGPSEFYIYRENRYALSGGFSENYFLTNRFGLFGEALYGYTFGYLKGSAIKADREFFPILSCGITLVLLQNEKFPWLLNLGYQYIGFSFSRQHSIFISIPLRIETRI